MGRAAGRGVPMGAGVAPAGGWMYTHAFHALFTLLSAHTLSRMHTYTNIHPRMHTHTQGSLARYVVLVDPVHKP